MVTPGAPPLIPPYPLPGHLRPFIHNSFASHFTPLGSFPSYPSYPMNSQSNFLSLPTFPLHSQFSTPPQPVASYHIPQPPSTGFFPFIPPPIVNNPQQQQQQKHFQNNNNNNNNLNVRPDFPIKSKQWLYRVRTVTIESCDERKSGLSL